jgi:8-oxo-dGTP pyrophosphatase MutT (NUDIX family)
MKSVFYAGGFLYNPTTKQVLLHLRDDKTKHNPNSWAFFGGLSKQKEKPIETFRREIHEELDIMLSPSQIRPLCNYYNPDFDVHRHVFYSQYSDTENKLKVNEGKDSGWFTLDEAFQLNLTKRTKQDLVFFKKPPNKQ